MDVAGDVQGRGSRRRPQGPDGRAGQRPADLHPGRPLEAEHHRPLVVSVQQGRAPDQNIEFNFGETVDNGGTGLQVTQYGTTSEAYKTIQDGYTAGSLAGLSFNDDGMLAAIYSNGISINLSQIALAKFENPEGLFKMGQNRFRESRLSGAPTIGAPEAGGRGKVTSKTIEASTTDIAQEFINLMTSERNFQANSRVVNVADQMMSEVLNMGRH